MASKAAAERMVEVPLQLCFNFGPFSGTNGTGFLSCHLLIEFSRRINASPLERDAGRGGHYRAFTD